MADARPWTVLPHRPIEKLEDNLWRVQGTLPKSPLRRVMTLARLEDGRVVIHSGICLDDEEMAEVEAWGTPSILLVPNGYHRLDAPAFKARYPKMTVLAPRGQTQRVAAAIPVDGTYEDFPRDPRVRLRTLQGVGESEGVMIVESGDHSTVVFNDTVFNMPHGKGLAGWVFRHITQSTGGPRISRLMRWFIVKDGAALRRDLEDLAGLPGLSRIIVSHHRTIEDDAAGTLRRIAATL